MFRVWLSPGCLGPLALAWGVGGMPAALAAPDSVSAPIHDPETELATAKTELDNLERRLNTARELARRQGLGPQTVSAERSYANALRYFERKEYLSTVRELNNFLNQTQVPVVKTYLKAQFMLGRAYEELGYTSRALRAYFRYLSAFLTSTEQDHAEMLDVLKRMLPLAASDASSAHQLNELLASVTSLDAPEALRPTIQYHAAKAAHNAGNRLMARDWLRKVISQAKEPGLKARALYMSSLLALSIKDYDQAEETLAEVMQADPDGETRDLARLALARVAVHRRKPTTAIKYYELVGENGPGGRDATFESIYVHLTLKQDQQARGKAMRFIARYPDAAETLQLRLLLAYLDMRAGDLSGATQSIAAADLRLKEVDGWIKKHFAGQGAVDQTRLNELLTLTGGHLPIPRSAQDAYELFGRIAEMVRRLTDLRGEIRDMRFTMGRANLAQLRPQWVNRAEQLARLGDDLLAVGHRLAAAERHLYRNRLDPTQWQKLTASEQRRTRLLSAGAAAHRQMRQWASFGTFLDFTRQAADSYEKLKQAEAELASGRFLVQASDQVKGEDEKQRRLSELQDRAQRLGETAARAVELLRRQKVEDLLNRSPHRMSRKFLAQYAVALSDEAAVLSSVRNDARSTAERLSAEDAQAAWRHWEFLAKECFGQIDALDQEIAGGLARMLGEIDAVESRHDDLAARLGDVTRELEGRLGRSLSYIVDQYSGAVRARVANHQKWRADIEWLGYQSKLEDERKLNMRHSLEQQILQDHLSDLQQGALWTWPK